MKSAHTSTSFESLEEKAQDQNTKQKSIPTIDNATVKGALWRDKYYSHAVQAIRHAVDDPSYLGWLKVLLGPELIKLEKRVTKDIPEKRIALVENAIQYRLISALLSFITLQHRVYKDGMILKEYEKFIDENKTQEINTINHKIELLNKGHDEFKSKDEAVKVSLSKHDLKKELAFLGKVIEMQESKKSEEYLSSLSEHASLLREDIRKLMPEDSFKKEDDLKNAIKREEIKKSEREIYWENEKSLYDRVVSSYKSAKQGMLIRSVELDEINYWMTNLNSKGLRILSSLEQEYEKAMSGLCTEDLLENKSAEKCMRDFVAKMNYKESRYNVVTGDIFEEFKHKCDKFLDKIRGSLEESSVDKVKESICIKLNKISDAEENKAASKINETVNKSIKEYYQNLISQKINGFFQGNSWLEFTKTKNREKLADNLLVQFNKLILMEDNLLKAIASSTYEKDGIEVKTENMNYINKSVVWLNKNKAKIPAEFAEEKPSVLCQNIVDTDIGSISLETVKDEATSESLMQIAYSLYQSATESARKRIALVINLLHSHEVYSASSFIVGATKKALYPSDWTITSGLLSEMTYNTQLAQQITEGLYKYAKKNDEMLNASAWKFWQIISSSFVNKTIKQGRLLPIHEFIDLLESGRNQINDILLFNKVKDIVNDRNWLQGRSSELQKIFKEIYEQCETQKILYFKTDIEDDAQTIKSLSVKNKELERDVDLLRKAHAEVGAKLELTNRALVLSNLESVKAREESVKAREESAKSREESAKSREESAKANEESVKANERSAKAQKEADSSNQKCAEMKCDLDNRNRDLDNTKLELKELKAIVAGIIVSRDASVKKDGSSNSRSEPAKNKPGFF